MLSSAPCMTKTVKWLSSCTLECSTLASVVRAPLILIIQRSLGVASWPASNTTSCLAAQPSSIDQISLIKSWSKALSLDSHWTFKLISKFCAVLMKKPVSMLTLSAKNIYVDSWIETCQRKTRLSQTLSSALASITLLQTKVSRRAQIHLSMIIQDNSKLRRHRVQLKKKTYVTMIMKIPPKYSQLT